MLDKAYGARTVRDHNPIAEAVIELLGNRRADYGIEYVVKNGAFAKPQTLFPRIPVVLEVVPVGSEYPKSSM